MTVPVGDASEGSWRLINAYAPCRGWGVLVAYSICSAPMPLAWAALHTPVTVACPYTGNWSCSVVTGASSLPHGVVMSPLSHASTCSLRVRSVVQHEALYFLLLGLFVIVHVNQTLG